MECEKEKRRRGEMPSEKPQKREKKKMKRFQRNFYLDNIKETNEKRPVKQIFLFLSTFCGQFPSRCGTEPSVQGVHPRSGAREAGSEQREGSVPPGFCQYP